MTTSKLTQAKSIIAVASGKGGVGKSTVAVNLALGLQKLGHRVGLLDADIYGPSQHLMLGLKDQDPVVDTDKKILPIKKFDLQAMSFGFFIKPQDAVVWRGPMVARVIQQFVDDVNWDDMDYLVVDLPPGTGDIQITLTQHLQVSGVVIVTTPQDIALADAIKGINMFRKVNVDILGIVENMSYFACPNCDHKAHIFSHNGGKNKAQEVGAPFLGELPLEEATRDAADNGTPIVAQDPESEQSQRFIDIAKNVDQILTKLKKETPEIKIKTIDAPPPSKFAV